MELDDLKAAWSKQGQRAASDAGADASTDASTDTARLVARARGRVARPLLGHGLFRLGETLIGVAALAVVLPVLVERGGDLRVLVCAGLVVLYALVLTILCAHSCVASLTTRPSDPVLAVQRDLDRLMFVDFAAMQWAVLGGCVVWLPAPLVLLEGLFGAPVLDQVDPSWLAANIAVGLVLALVLHLVARRFARRLSGRGDAPVPRIVEALAGRGLVRAAQRLREVRAFQRGDDALAARGPN
jgi:hypothetical protein